MFSKKYIYYFFKSGQTKILIFVGLVWGLFTFNAGIQGDPFAIYAALFYILIVLIAYIGTWIYWKNARLD